jgi:hypothetical protein
LNVFPGLGSTNTNTSVTVPLSLNIVHNRTVNNFSVNIAHSRNESTNAFANVQNVGGLAGINYPTAASTDPANWGVPRLSFTGFTGVFGAPATSRTPGSPADTWLHLRDAPAPDRRRYRLDRSAGVLTPTRPARSPYRVVAWRYPGSDATGNSASFAASCSAFRARRRGSAARQSFEADRGHRRQLAEEREAHAQHGRSLRAAAPHTEANGLPANPTPHRDSHRRAEPGWRHRTIHGSVPAGLINTDTNNIGPRLVRLGL